MFNLWGSRRKSDRADSSLVTMIFLLPLFFSFLMTMIDTSVYFGNKASVQQISRDAARTVAIFGGNGNSTSVSPLEKSYGAPTAACADSRAVNRSSIECQLLERYNSGAGLTNVDIRSVECGPPRSEAIGQSTYCEVGWLYNGIPGSVMSFIQRGGSPALEAPWCPEGAAALQCNRTRVTGQSEVNMSNVPLTNR